MLAAIVALSSGNWLARRDRFALYFPGSVKGLDKGAPVTLPRRQGRRGARRPGHPHRPSGRPHPDRSGDRGPAQRRRSAAGAERARRPAAVRRRRRTSAQRPDRARHPRAPQEREPAPPDEVHRPRLLPRSRPASRAAPRYPQLPSTPTAAERLGERAEAIVEKLSDLPIEQMLRPPAQDARRGAEGVEVARLAGSLAGANPARGRWSRRWCKWRPPSGRPPRRSLPCAAKGPDGEEARQTLRALHKPPDRRRRAVTHAEGTLSGADDTRLIASQALEN